MDDLGMNFEAIEKKLNSVPTTLSNEDHFSSELPVSDQSFCKEQNELFKKTYNQIENSLKVLEYCDKNNIEDISTYHHYDNGNISVDRSLNCKWSERSLFSFKHSILKAKKLQACLKHDFISSVFSHFNNKYNLNLISGAFAEDYKEVTLENILDYISVNTGEFAFDNAGFQLLYKAFKNNFYKRNAPKLSKNKVSFPRISYIEQNYSGEYEVSEWKNSGKSYKTLVKTLVYFFRGSLDLIPDIHFFPFNKPLDFSDIYPFPNFEGFEGIKFFKNNRIDLVFSTSIKATEYFEMFDLNNVIEN